MSSSIVQAKLRENPLYCAACGKVFAKQTVFDFHLLGKKHIGKLRAAGKTAEADALQLKADDSDKAKAAAAVLKRKREEDEEEERGGADQSQKGGAAGGKSAKQKGENGRSSEAAAAAGGDLDVPAAGIPALGRNEWWKGTMHAAPPPEVNQDEEEDDHKTRGEWICSSYNCDKVNFRHAPKCQKCGAIRRFFGQGKTAGGTKNASNLSKEYMVEGATFHGNRR